MILNLNLTFKFLKKNKRKNKYYRFQLVEMILQMANLKIRIRFIFNYKATVSFVNSDNLIIIYFFSSTIQYFEYKHFIINKKLKLFFSLLPCIPYLTHVYQIILN